MWSESEVLVGGVHVERRDGLAVLRLDKPRGNAIDAPLLDALLQAANALAKDATVSGVMLASAHPKLFCPGLDLVTLIDYDRLAMERFMLRFAEVVWALFGLPKPLVAAVGGHAVAGGCVLTLTADHRVVRRGAQVGLNEVKIGVPLPWSASVLLRARIPASALTAVALQGRNFADEEALAYGLADEVADDDAFDQTALTRLRELADKDAAAFATTKSYLRADALAAMRAHEREHIGAFLDGWFSAPTRERIKQMVDSLTRRSGS